MSQLRKALGFVELSFMSKEIKIPKLKKKEEDYSTCAYM